MQYVIPPHASRVYSTDVTGPSARTGYAFVTAQDGEVPFTAGLIRSRSGDVWTSESLVSSGESQVARFAVSSIPTLIRHGEIDTEFIISNASQTPAVVRFTLHGVADVVKRIAAHQQLTVRLTDLFGDRAQGVVRLESDVPVGVSARQITTNFRAESIAVELPQVEPRAGTQFGYVANGGGVSTEFRLVNLSLAPVGGTLEFRTPSGQLARETILR